MNRQAEKVVTDLADVERIQRMISELPSLARVRLVLHDGSSYVGTVIERPAAQQFLDPEGQEGINAQLRLDDPTAPAWTIDLWLSDVARIERLDPPNP